MPAFYSSNHGTAGSGRKLGSPKILTAALWAITPLHTADLRPTMRLVNLAMEVPTMPQCLMHQQTLGRGTGELREACYFVLDGSSVQRDHWQKSANSSWFLWLERGGSSD